MFIRDLRVMIELAFHHFHQDEEYLLAELCHSCVWICSLHCSNPFLGSRYSLLSIFRRRYIIAIGPARSQTLHCIIFKIAKKVFAVSFKKIRILDCCQFQRQVGDCRILSRLFQPFFLQL